MNFFFFDLLRTASLAMLVNITLNFAVFEKITFNLLKKTQITLKKEGIHVPIKNLKTNFYPYPHIYATYFRVPFANKVVVDAYKFTIAPDILSLLSGQTEKFTLMKIADVKVRVLKTNTPRNPWPIKKSVGVTKNLTTIIPHQMSIARRIYIEKFQVFIDYIDTQRPYVFGNNLHLKGGDPIIHVRSTFQVSNWIKGHFYGRMIRAKKPNSQNWLERVELDVRSQLKLSKLTGSSSGISLDGNIFSQSYFTVLYPMTIIQSKSKHMINDLRVLWNKKKEVLNLTGKPIKISLNGDATSKEIKSSINMNWQKGSLIATKFRWTYGVKKIYLKFQNSNLNQLTLNELHGHLGKSIHRSVKNYLNSANGKILFSDIILSPWRGAYATQVYFSAFSPNFLLPRITTKIKINSKQIFTPLFTMKRKNSAFKISKLTYKLNQSKKISGKVNFDLKMKDFNPESSGKINSRFQFSCKLHPKLNCKKDLFRINTEKLKLNRDLMIKVFKIPLKNWPINNSNYFSVKNSFIEGSLIQNKVNIQNSRVETNSGIYRSTGYLYPFMDKGNFKVTFFPFKLEKITNLIPIFAPFLNITISLAAELIIYVDYSKGNFSIKRYTIGRAVDSIRNLFK